MERDTEKRGREIKRGKRGRKKNIVSNKTKS